MMRADAKSGHFMSELGDMQLGLDQLGCGVVGVRKPGSHERC